MLEVHDISMVFDVMCVYFWMSAVHGVCLNCKARLRYQRVTALFFWSPSWGLCTLLSPEGQQAAEQAIYTWNYWNTFPSLCELWILHIYIVCVCVCTFSFLHDAAVKRTWLILAAVIAFSYTFLPFISVACVVQLAYFASHVCTASLVHTMLFRLLYNWYVLPRVRRCSTEESSVSVHPHIAAASRLVRPVRFVSRLGLPQDFKSGNGHLEYASSYFASAAAFFCSLQLPPRCARGQADIPKLSSGDARIWTLCVWPPVTAESCLCYVFFFPDPRDSSSVIFLDSLLLMWQPMCHHAPALRRSHFRSEHTASTAGAATFPLLYQMLLKYEHRIYMNLLARSAARSHSNFAWTWPFTAHAI